MPNHSNEKIRIGWLAMGEDAGGVAQAGQRHAVLGLKRRLR